MIKIQDLILGATMRAAHIPRYSAIPVNHRESVAEHSFFVAIYADRIAVDLGLQHNIQAILKTALWHDIEETLTGDFIRSFKYHDLNLKKAMDFAAEGCAFKVFDEMLQNKQQAQDALSIWQNAKDYNIESRVVKFADFLSVVAYLAKECAMGNHYTMHMMRHALPDYLKSFYQDDEYRRFQPYLSDVQEIMRGGWKDVRVTI